MLKRNSYYSIACNEFYYLRDSVSDKYCNPSAAQAQQVAEKMLKSVAELVCVGIEKLMLSHNLRALYDAIHREEPEFVLDRNALSTLKDYYFDARYPGDNFVVVNCEELREALDIMVSVVNAVENWRMAHSMETIIGDVLTEFKPAFLRLGDGDNTSAMHIFNN